MLIDSHAHMDMTDFSKDRTEVLERAVDGNVTKIVTVGIDIESSIAAIELARKNGFVFASVGYHPHNAKDCNQKTLNELARMASERSVIAWGEIGLDFYRSHSPHDEQRKVFSDQLRLADDLGLPVIIHDRNAHSEVLAQLKKMGRGERKGVIHCFSGDVELAHTLIDLGYFISIPGTVTYTKASQVKAVASAVPMNRLLIETDAPFLAPVPKRGKRNEPLFVRYTAEEIAGLRNMDFEEVALATSKNARDLFGLP